MLLSILGELENYEGKILRRAGKVCYVPKEPWIFKATIRENITFGSEFDREKFDRVIEACSLRQDIECLPLFESTPIEHDRGISLTLAQKARISLFVKIKFISNLIVNLNNVLIKEQGVYTTKRTFICLTIFSVFFMPSFQIR